MADSVNASAFYPGEAAGRLLRGSRHKLTAVTTRVISQSSSSSSSVTALLWGGQEKSIQEASDSTEEVLDASHKRCQELMRLSLQFNLPTP